MRQQPRRVRDLGVVIGDLPTGRLNAITDVAGVRVGHTTIDDGADLHTGVTAVVPDQLDERRTLPAAVYAGNGHGKLVGSTQVDEFGVMESPIVLTATLSVFRAADAVLTYLMERHPDGLTFNPLVGETNDGLLSDIRRRPITEQHVLAALRTAAPGLPAEGCVGAGTGTVALGYKGGIGTASRVVGVAGRDVIVGALVQSNFSGVLTVQGVPMPARELLPDAVASPAALPVDRVAAERAGGEEPAGNSCMIVVATDAPLDARRLGRLARRAVFAMARVGAAYSNGSGDYGIAFSTAPPDAPLIDDAALNPVFAATMDAVEEALLNSLFTAVTTIGVEGRTAYAVPHDAVVRRLAARGAL